MTRVTFESVLAPKGKIKRPLHRLRAYRETLRAMVHSHSFAQPQRFALRKALMTLEEQFPELGDVQIPKKSLSFSGKKG